MDEIKVDAEQQIYLANEEEIIKNAKEIVDASKNAEKYIFCIMYKATEKTVVLSEIKRLECEILEQSDSKSSVTVRVSMSQLAAIKTLNYIERVEVVKNKATVSNIKTSVLNNTDKNGIMNTKAVVVTEQLSLSAESLDTESANDGISLMRMGEEAGRNYDNSNTMQTAINLPLSTSKSGSINCPYTEIWYKFTASIRNASQYTIYTSGSLDTVGYLYNSSGEFITSNDDGIESLNFSITRALTYGATYYVKVKAYNSNTGSYSVRVNYTTASSSGSGSGATRSNSMSSAIQLSLNSWRSGVISCPCTEMWYKFIPSTTTYYTIYTNGALDTIGYLYNTSSKQLDYDDDDGSGTNFKIVHRLTAGQTYYIKVKAFGRNTGNFSIKITNTVFVESVAINNASVTLNKGDSITLTANVLPSYATNKSLRWESSDTSVVTVNSSTGKVTAINRGSAYVSAYSKDGSGKSSCCEIIVNVSATSVSVTPTTKSMCVGDTAYLTATVYPANADNKSVTWYSSNPEIVSVNHYSGRITANSAGTATITATTVCGGFSDTCIVKCEYFSGMSSAIQLNLNNWLCDEIGCPCTETWYKFTPSTTTYYTIYTEGLLDTIGYLYDSNSNQINSDDDNGSGLNFKIVHRLTAGQTYYIKVKAFGRNTGNFSIKITNTVFVESVAINNASVTLNKGDSITLTANVLPSYATNKSLRWESSDTSVVTVNSSTGKVTAINRGSACVCAYCKDGSGKIGCCEVVVKVPVESVTVDISTRIMHVGTSDRLTATICPDNANNKLLRWTSSNTEVASVDSTTGYVTAQAVGTANIYATAQDGTGKYGVCTLKVEPAVPVQSITMCCNTHTMNVGETTYLCYDISPANATNKAVVWCSSNPNVAEVNASTGRITAKLAGTTIITATTYEGSLVASCTVTVNYCGGSDYRNVTKHTLVLQNDGYYVCLTCGYRIKSPSLQDKNILSEEDYLKVIAAIHYYTQNKLLADKYPNSAYFYNSEANNAKVLIDTIRSKNEYATHYEYKGFDGKYLALETNEVLTSFAQSSTINALTIGNYNGVYASICEMVIGYYCPEVAAIIDITQLVTNQMNALDFGAFVADIYDLSDYGLALSVASTILGAATSEICIGDKVINISFNAYAHAEYIISNENKIKQVRIFYPA